MLVARGRGPPALRIARQVVAGRPCRKPWPVAKGRIDSVRIRGQVREHRRPWGARKSPTSAAHLFLLVNSSLPERHATDPQDVRPQTASASGLQQRGDSGDRGRSVPGPVIGERRRARNGPASAASHRACCLSRELTTLRAPGRVGEAARSATRPGSRPRRDRQGDRAPLLVDGDFYEPEDKSQYGDDPGWDLTMRAFAWPCLLQAAGFVSVTGGKLGLSPAGRKAMVRPSHEVTSANALGQVAQGTRCVRRIRSGSRRSKGKLKSCAAHPHRPGGARW